MIFSPFSLLKTEEKKSNIISTSIEHIFMKINWKQYSVRLIEEKIKPAKIEFKKHNNNKRQKTEN